ncbi:MAG: hypothetical protein WCI02_09670 [Planctomycetota bacterium]
MSWNPAEIERIVREVLQTILSSQGSALGSAPAVVAAAIPASFTIAESVVSLESLRALPKEVRHISIGPNAILTPAVRDWCRERSIAIERSPVAAAKQIAAPESAPHGNLATEEMKSEAIRPQRLFVSGSALWLKSLEKQLCPKQTRVSELQGDDAGTIRSVAVAIRQGFAGAIAIVSAPHAALWQAARDDALRPVVLSQWSDLADALREVPTNVLIVPAQRWNISGTANIARHYVDYLRSKS